MKLLLIFVACSLVLSAGGQANATLVDFRTTAFTLGGPDPDHAPLAEMVADGITIRVVPRPTPDAELYWDTTDGFGVRHAYERDEIEMDETLLISFWDGADAVSVNLSHVHLTDLFKEKNDPGDYSYREEGWYDVGDDGSVVWFEADPTKLPSPASNGERTLAIGGPVHMISFGAPGLRPVKEDHEFSVAAIDFTTLPIPEPSSLVLFAIGAAIVGGSVRRA